jgi:beta-lactamase regulating signal transducer with metallopeptidase domain
MDTVPQVLDRASQVWLHWMWPMAWQVALMGLVIFVVALLARKASPRFRYFLWCLLLLKLCLPPTLSFVTGAGRWVLPKQAAAIIVAASPSADMPAPTPEDAAAPLVFSPNPGIAQTVSIPDPATPATISIPKAAFHLSWVMALGATWCLGVVALLFLFVIQHRRMGRLIAASGPVDDAGILRLLEEAKSALGVSSPVRLLSMEKLHSPILFGVLRPTIAIPRQALESLPPEQIRPILLHELAHLRRKDLWMAFFQLCVQVLYWFHPVVWLANRQLRRERELIVDDIVLAQLREERASYGASLLNILEQGPRRWLSVPAYVGIIETPGALTNRIKRILDTKRKISVRLGWPGLLALIVLGLVMIPQAQSRAATTESVADSAVVTLSAPTAVDPASPQQTDAQTEELPAREFRRAADEIYGVVVTADGQPVSDAMVCMMNEALVPEQYRDSFSDVEEAGLTWKPWPPAASTQSQEDGAFRFNRMLNGVTDIWAEHPKFGKGWVRGVSLPDKDTPLRILLSPQPDELRFRGVIHDTAGAPAEGASVLLYAETRGSRWYDLVAQVTTANQGSFDIKATPPFMPPRRLWLLCIPKEGAIVYRALPPCSADDLSISLRPESHLTGLVFDNDPKPLPGATATLYKLKMPDQPGLFFWGDMAPSAPSADADADGLYRLERVPIGSEAAVVAHHPAQTDNIEFDIYSENARTTVAAIVLEQGIIFQGTVKYADTGRPAPNVVVRFQSPPPPVATRTDAQGAFTIGWPHMGSAGSLTLQAQSDEEPPQWSGVVKVSKELFETGDRFEDLQIVLEKRAPDLFEEWRGTPGAARPTACSVVVLDNADPAYTGKENYDDTLSAYGADGKLIWQVAGFNVCEEVGGSHKLIWNARDRSLWVVENVADKVRKFMPDGKLLWVKDLKATALAADPATGSVRAILSSGTIYGDGSIDISPDGTPGRKMSVAGNDIAYSALDDCFWLVGKEVLKVSRDGEVLNEPPEPFAWVAVSVAVNDNDGSVWVLEREHSQVYESRNYVHILNRDGSPRGGFPVPSESALSLCLALDPSGKFVWVGGRDGVYKFNPAGEVLCSAPLDANSLAVEPDTGYVWAAGPSGIYRLDNEARCVLNWSGARASHKYVCVIP